MNNKFTSIDIEPLKEQAAHMSLHDKVQKLIDAYTSLKEKYNSQKEYYEKTLTVNIELDDEKSQWMNEKNHLEQKISKLDEELQIKSEELRRLHDANNELENITKIAVSKIDSILSQCETDT